MQLFFDADFTPPHHTLREEESKHAVRVLRLGVGDRLHLTNGRGLLCACRIVDDNPKHCSVVVEESFEEFEKRPYRLTMAVAPTKNIDRFEWFLEKATEVGVDRIVPLETAHSERRAFKQERGQKVVTAAVKQSLKAYHPCLEELMSFKQLLDEPFEGERFIAHCQPAQSAEGKIYLPHILKPGAEQMILVGPEGDFSPEEVAMALACGFREISLGEQRLRTETAAVVATVMVAVANASVAPELKDKPL